MTGQAMVTLSRELLERATAWEDRSDGGWGPTPEQVRDKLEAQAGIRKLLAGEPPRFYPTPAKVTKSMVLCAYCHATHNPNQFMHGTSNWCAAVANSLNEQMEQPK